MCAGYLTACFGNSMMPESVRASCEAGELLLEAMEEVLSQLDAMRASRRGEAVVEAWRGRLQHKSARRERDACAMGMAEWSRKHGFFYLLLAHQQRREAARAAAAYKFWRHALLQSVFGAWGPLFKLRQAERIGEADRSLRRALQRCRSRAVLDR